MNAPRRQVDVVVVGGGPAGTFAALRAGDLGAHTVLVTSGDFGGMAANDGPAPVRTLAHAARLLRDARQLGRYGVEVGEPKLDYVRLLGRVGEVVTAVRDSSALRPQLEKAGVEIRERTGPVRFADAHTLETQGGERLSADRVILCPGGVSRRLQVPGAELCATHSDAWALTSVPPSLLVIGAGATGVQVASVFHAFGARVQLFQAAERIIPTEEPEVSAAVAAAFRDAGMAVHEAFGDIEAFEKTPDGVRMIYVKDGERRTAEAALAVLAVGWSADTAGLNLAAAGVATDARGFIAVDQCLRTSASHVWAAGDVTGGLMLAPQAIQAGFVAATNAVRGEHLSPDEAVSPIGSFTDPEYAQVGLSEARAGERHEIEVVRIGYDAMTRAIIDGRTTGFCKLIVDRVSHQILGCHLVGERAVDIAQIAAVAMAGRMRIDELARVPLSFPTYAGVLARAAATAAHRLNREEALPPAVPA
jgi:pyruvate/2-oxoglutarate dehydrogenase complex dihydrolipoamide dehydrogenase (E3) component